MISKLSQSELIANMEAAAQKLTGRAVKVCIVSMDGAYGLTWKNIDRQAVINLAPQVFTDIELFKRIFTHELAHVRLHIDQIPATARGEFSERDAMVFKILRQAGNKKIDDRESEAKYLAARWMKALKSWDYTYSHNDPFIAVLKILYRHPNGE